MRTIEISGSVDTDLSVAEIDARLAAVLSELCSGRGWNLDVWQTSGQAWETSGQAE